MAISEERKKEFEKKTPEEMSKWLIKGLTGYVLEDKARWALDPFELFMGTSDSTGSDIVCAYKALSVSGQKKFDDAIVLMLKKLDTSPQHLQLWMIGVEIAWALGLKEARIVVEDRLSERAAKKQLFSEELDDEFTLFSFLHNI